MLEDYMYDVFLFLTILLGIQFFVAVVLLQFNRLIKEGIGKKKKIIKRKTESFLTALVFDELPVTDPLCLKKIKSFRSEIPFEKPWCKDLLINHLIKLDTNFKGDVKDKSRDIYLNLGLYSYSLSLLESSAWYIKIKGIFQLQKMGCLTAEKLLRKYTQHPNKQLRSVALVAYISVAETDPLHVLDNYTGKISKIEELKIFQVIKGRKIKMPKNLENWLLSSNSSLVVLGIRLLGYYNRIPDLDGLKHLLQSDNERIRKETIILVKKLFLVDFEEELVRLFEGETENNRLQIMKTLGVMGGELAIGFFEVILKVDISKELSMLAMRGIKQINEAKLEDQKFNSGELLKVKKHINDPLLTW